jgi:hypothetical protein
MLETVFQFKTEDERSSARRERAPFDHLALVGNALPRKCGLATFTNDVADALRQRYPTMTVDHYAMASNIRRISGLSMRATRPTTVRQQS